MADATCLNWAASMSCDHSGVPGIRVRPGSGRWNFTAVTIGAGPRQELEGAVAKHVAADAGRGSACAVAWVLGLRRQLVRDDGGRLRWYGRLGEVARALDRSRCG